MNQSMNENEAQCCEGVDVQYDNKTKATLASPRKQKQNFCMYTIQKKTKGSWWKQQELQHEE